MKKAIIFDLDGTLVDSLGDICGHLNRVRRDYGLAPRGTEEIRPYIGHGVDYLARFALPELPESEIDEVVRRFRAYYLENPHVEGRLYPGVRETLQQLRSRSDLALAVATNKASRVAERALEHYLPGIRFDTIAGPDRVSARKPDPAHLREVLERIDVPAERAWYVGDHDVDRDVAKAAGVAFLGATYGFCGVEVPEAQRLTHFRQLLEKIRLD